ncbi:MAG TPA: hypothetical protein VE263_07210 [Candidatus Angelobacter sp.]|nr:hypothetical protein [Candidatus Angelobacter sp.]
MCNSIRPFCLVLVLAIAALPHGEGDASPMPNPQTSSPQLVKFLSDQNIWGPDAPQVFAYLDRWKSEGESSIQIFSDRVVGSAKYETAAQAKERADRLSQAMKRPAAKLSSEVATSFKAAPGKKTAPFQLESARFLEDDSFRLIARREGAEFLKRGLTMSAVSAAYGPPEKTSTEVVQALGDRRPVVLTISEYDGGKIKFVQSDHSPDPNVVDRVVLDISAAAAVALASH